MECEHQLRLSAFHDRQMPETEARRLEEHLISCETCRTTLVEIQRVTFAFSTLGKTGPSIAVKARARLAADMAASEVSSSVPFVLSLLTGLAASLLVIAWIWTDERLIPGNQEPKAIARVATIPEWEQIAMTLQVDPLPSDSTGVPDQPALAEARLTDWMLQNLAK